MYKYLFTAGLIISSYILGIAGNDLFLKKLYYENSMGEKGVTTFFYSQENKNYKASWQLIDESRSSVNYHFFNDKGNLIRKYREFSDSMTSNVFYKYNEDGNLIEEYFERSDDVKGIAWYSYKDGKKVKAECRGLNGWFYGNIFYYYENEVLNKADIFKAGKKIGIITYDYDEDGKLINEFWKFEDRWSQTFTYEYGIPDKKKPKAYTYSNSFIKETNKYIVTKENYEWNGEGKSPSYYVYEGNKLIEKVYKFKGLETTTSYEYDDNGLLMKSFRKYTDGRKAEFSYHYNDERQLLRRLFFMDNGFEGGETYFYDENGILIKAIWDKFDTWLTGELKFVYDENNELKSALFEGKDSFDANIDFQMDTNKNIVHIHWNFSFGKTQDYYYSYK